jgi:iron-sulfur cluster assembly protein
MINLTEASSKQIKELKGKGQSLRIAVVGGGCSGLSYKLEFEKESKEGDKIFEVDGVNIFVDPKSALYLKGLTLDYTSGLNGSGFVFQNPNASKSCGCGTSFGV